MYAGSEQVDLIAEELIGILYLDAVPFHHILGEISRILSDDHLSPASNGCSQNVTIIRIGQRQTFDQLVIAGDKAIIYCLAHQFASSFQLVRIQVWPVGLEVPEYLVQDRVGPPRLKDSGASESDEDIPEHVGVEHIGIKDDGESTHS